MGRKSRKYFFGIFEDGPVLKIAQIINSNGHPILIDIKKTEMECSIYHEGSVGSELATPDFMGEETTLEALPEINLDEQEELDSVISPHEHLLSIFPLNQGKIGLNANDEKLAVHYLDRPIKSLTRRELIKLDLLNSEEMRDKDVIWGILQTAQDQTCVMVHKGENRLFSYLQKYNQIQSERKYFYSLIDSNDISIINAVCLNYELNKEDDVLVIYLGFDYKKGIIMKGNEFVKSLPILTSSDSYDLEREICSRLALYQDEMEIPHIDKVILAGEYCQDDMLDAISNTFPAAEVGRFKFSNLLFSENLGEEIPEEELAANLIPISLAWKILAGKSNEIIHTNFLEKKIIKSQRLVQFSWHSFLMLAVLLGISFTYTNNILESQKSLRLLEVNYLNKKNQYEQLKSEHDPGPDIQAQIAQLTAKLEKMKELYKDKAIWSQILEELTTIFKQNPVSWLTNLQGNVDGFSIFGATTRRENIIKFSQAYPNGIIKSVRSREWEKDIVWIFEIRFDYLPALNIVQSWSKVDQSSKRENKPAKITETKVDISPKDEPDPIETPEPVAVSIPKASATKEKKKQSIDPIYEEYRRITRYYYEFEHDSLLIEAPKFIEKYPKNELSTNCRYLVAEILLRNNRLNEAEKLLDKVMSVESPMEPYALFKLAQIYRKTERPYLAIVNLNLLMRKFPHNDVIDKAKSLLMEIEGNHE